jgi:hypothetical protein
LQWSFGSGGSGGSILRIASAKSNPLSRIIRQLLYMPFHALNVKRGIINLCREFSLNAVHIAGINKPRFIQHLHYFVTLNGHLLQCGFFCGDSVFDLRNKRRFVNHFDSSFTTNRLLQIRLPPAKQKSQSAFGCFSQKRLETILLRTTKTIPKIVHAILR